MTEQLSMCHNFKSWTNVSKVAYPRVENNPVLGLISSLEEVHPFMLCGLWL